MEVQTRHECSFFSLLLRKAIRPFKPRLTAPNKVFPAGSNSLTPHRSILKTCLVKKREYDGIGTYDVLPKPSDALGGSASGRGDAPMRLYYFAGGGWQMLPSSQHWKFCAEAARMVPGLAVSVVSPPLAPNSPAAVALPQLEQFCRSVLQQGVEDGEKIIFGGDSSGGNLVLGLTMQILMKKGEGEEEEEEVPRPAALLLISPAVDLRPMKEEGVYKSILGKDPVLTIDGHNGEAANWCKDSADRSEACLSPITGDMSLLAKAGIKVIGVTGGYDILTPDAIKVRDHCQEMGVGGSWLHWEKQMHCFPLAFMYRLPEGVQSKDWILEQLGKI